jgi:hypothetical protein
MTGLAYIFITLSVLSGAIIFGTDVFSAIVLRPALALVDDQTLVSTMGRVHQFADRRLRVPGITSVVFAVAGTAALAGARHWGAAIVGAVGVVALVTWLVIYARISAPINSRLTAASKSGEVPTNTRELQRRWDSVIDTRSALQMVALLSLCIALISS